MGLKVVLNVYDVTNTQNENTNSFIQRLNNVTRELNFGGVFHGAIEIDDVEWSFGYCESGTGVYSCRARSNTLYCFRETVELGVTNKSKQEIKEMLTRFKRSWPGTSYDLLQRNCCHFCEDFCTAIEVPGPPAWLNRFAQGADATVKFTNEASALAKRVGANLSITAQQSANWLRDVSARVMAQVATTGGPDGGGPPDAPSGGGDDQGFGPSTPYRSAHGPEQMDAESDLGTRSEPVATGVGRLASRLRLFSPPSAPSASPGGSGLPASTAAGAGGGDLGSGPGSIPSSMTFPSALRQKWQELEASAGDGTKQFLFGLIKTRNSRLDDEDPALFASSSTSNGMEDMEVPRAAATGSGFDASGRGGARAGLGASSFAGGGAAAARAPTEPPPQQVISHTLLPMDVVGGAPSAVALSAVGAVGGGDGGGGGGDGNGGGVSRTMGGMLGQPAIHLLD